MRKVFLLLLVLVYSLCLSAQVVSTIPAFVTENSGSIEIIFDANQGTRGLAGYTGVVYAHTGVITSKSVSDSNWKYVQSNWGQNLPKLALTSLGNDKHKLVISPSIREFYGAPASETIEKLAFVFRSATAVNGNFREGKDLVNGAASDIFVIVHEYGQLSMNIVSPAGNMAVQINTSLDFVITTSEAVTIDLLMDNTIVKTEASAERLQYTHTFSTTGDFMFVAKATGGETIIYDTIHICVPTTAPTGALPVGVIDGINYNQNEVTFVLRAPNKQNVFLIGDFNDFILQNNYQLKKDGDLWWYTFTDADPDRLYRFQYVVDDGIRISDPYTELVLDPSDGWINTPTNIRFPNMPTYPAGKTSGTVSVFQINKPQYEWEITDFVIPNKSSIVIYELLLRDFTSKQSLQGALNRLDYLENLGVTAIELMPIMEFDGNSSWGYNPNHYFAPDKAYGSPEMYKKFIDECHKRGIAVILDVVPNHATGAHPFAKLYWNSTNNETAADNPWFNVRAPHPWSVYHDFNHSKEIVREHFKRMFQYWLEEYNVDGFRFDLSKGITQRQSTESTAGLYDEDRIAFLTEYYEAAKAANPNMMFILEHFCEDREENELASRGMYLWRNRNDAYSQAAMGYQSNSSFSGMNASMRVAYGESHDEERNFFKAKEWGVGNVSTDSIARMKRVPLNMAFITLIPGPKMIWQFGEIGYDISIDANGRTGEKPSGFRWFDNSELRREAYYNSAKIVNLRKQFPTAFSEGTAELNVAQSDWNSGRRIAISHNDLNLVVVGNFRADASITANPNFQKTGTWYELMSETTLDVTNTNMTLTLNVGEVKVFVDREVQLPDMPNIYPSWIKNVQQAQQHVTVYPVPSHGKIFVQSELEPKNVLIYNLSGLLKGQYYNTNEIDLSNFPNGFYLLEIVTVAGKSIHKIIKN